MSILTTSSGAQTQAIEEVDYSIGATPDSAFGIGQIQRDIAPENQYLSIIVDIKHDTIPEGKESFSLVIAPIRERQQFTPKQSTTTVTIIDDDGK